MVSGTRRQTDFVELELQEQPRYRGEKPPTRPAPPPDRNNRPPLPAAPAAPQPPFEVEHLARVAAAGTENELRVRRNAHQVLLILCLQKMIHSTPRACNSRRYLARPQSSRSRLRQAIEQRRRAGEQWSAARQHQVPGNLVRPTSRLVDDQNAGQAIPRLDVPFVIGVSRPLGHHRQSDDAGAHAAQRTAVAQRHLNHWQGQVGRCASGDADGNRRLGKIGNAACMYRHAVAPRTASAHRRIEPRDAGEIDQPNHRLARNYVGDRDAL